MRAAAAAAAAASLRCGPKHVAALCADSASPRLQISVRSDDGNRLFLLHEDEGERYQVTNHWGTCCQTWTDVVTVRRPGWHRMVLEMQEGMGAAYA